MAPFNNRAAVPIEAVNNRAAALHKQVEGPEAIGMHSVEICG